MTSLVGPDPVAFGEWVGGFQGLAWIGVAGGFTAAVQWTGDTRFLGSLGRAEAGMKLIEDVTARAGIIVDWHDASLSRRRGFATRGV